MYKNLLYYCVIYIVLIYIIVVKIYKKIGLKIFINNMENNREVFCGEEWLIFFVSRI